MDAQFLTYKLHHNYVHNWLISGMIESAEKEAVTLVSSFQSETIPDTASKKYPPLIRKPVELSPVKRNHPAYWKWFECREDHWIDLTHDFHQETSVEAYVYSIVSVSSKQTAKMVVTSNTTVTVWLNHKPILDINHPEDFVSGEVDIPLRKGQNQLLLAFRTAAKRQTSILAAVRLDNILSDCEILIPNHEYESGVNETRQTLEKITANSFLTKYVFGSLMGDKYDRNEPIPILFSDKLQESGQLDMRLQDLDGYIYQEGEKKVHGGQAISAAVTFPLKEGAFEFVIQPDAHDYYIRKMMFDRRHRFFMVRGAFSSQHYGTFDERKAELIKIATEKKHDDIYIEVAKMAAGKWNYLDNKRIQSCLKVVSQRLRKAELNLVGFLGILYRFEKDANFPSQLKESIQNAIAGYFNLPIVPDPERSEAESILFSTSQILAGQWFKSDKQHGIHCEELYQQGIHSAIYWIQQRGKYGFIEWNSSENYADILVALTHLVDFCEDDTVSELAAVLIDKLLFLLATNTFKGSLGGPHARCQLGTIVTSRLEPTSGVCRLMWGMGEFNHEVAAPLSLALSNYSMPEIIAKIAQDSAASVWILQSHRNPEDEKIKDNTVNIATYKTHDYMLSSCQDFQPGKKGSTEHVWQATLGPDAVVFTNHPGNTADDDLHIPSQWRGNRILPRIGQWGDFLIAIYRLPENDWTGYTHCYFPIHSFDEVNLSDDWAFARKDDAFLAIYSSLGLTSIQHGPTAFRELRSYGNINFWLCQMGHSLLDRSFQDFQSRVLSISPAIDGTNISVNNIRGDTISFGWDTPFLVNRQEQPLAGFSHHQSIYCQASYPAEKMVIISQEDGLQLNFSLEA